MELLYYMRYNYNPHIWFACFVCWLCTVLLFQVNGSHHVVGCQEMLVVQKYLHGILDGRERYRKRYYWCHIITFGDLEFIITGYLLYCYQIYTFFRSLQSASQPLIHYFFLFAGSGTASLFSFTHLIYFLNNTKLSYIMFTHPSILYVHKSVSEDNFFKCTSDSSSFLLVL